MQSNNRRLAGGIRDGHKIEAQRTRQDVPFAQEIVNGAQRSFVLLFRYAHFAQDCLAFPSPATPSLHYSQRLAFVADQSQLPFNLGWHCVAHKEGLARAPRVPARIRLPTLADLQRPVFSPCLWLFRKPEVLVVTATSPEQIQCAPRFSGTHYCLWFMLSSTRKIPRPSIFSDPTGFSLFRSLLASFPAPSATVFFRLPGWTLRESGWRSLLVPRRRPAVERCGWSFRRSPA